MAVTSLGPPVVGAYICPVIHVPLNSVTSTSETAALVLPAGLSAVIVGISIQGEGLTDEPTIQVGSASTAAKYLASQAVSSVGAVTAPVGTRPTVAAGGTISVAVANNTTASHGGVNVGVWMYVSAAATNSPSS